LSSSSSSQIEGKEELGNGIYRCYFPLHINTIKKKNKAMTTIIVVIFFAATPLEV
jgi:hypothetical protein